MSTISTYIKKSIDYSSSVLYDRPEVVTAPLWSTEKSELNKIYINQNQPHHQKLYYRNVYSDPINQSPSDVEFSITYGNVVNSGSSTGSFGLLDGITVGPFNFIHTGSAGDNGSEVKSGQYRISGSLNQSILISRFDSQGEDIYYTLIQHIRAGQRIKLVKQSNQLIYQIIRVKENPTSIGDQYWNIPFDAEYFDPNIINNDEVSITITYPTDVLESYTNYTQYRTMLSDYETRNTLSSGSFRFVGLGSTEIGPYVWGATDKNLNPISAVFYPSKLQMSQMTSFERRYVKSIDIRSTDLEHMFKYQNVYLINNEGVLFEGYPNSNSVGIDTDWKTISIGRSHQLALKEDGTLWSWGRNDFGQLGLGYKSNTLVTDPIKIGKQYKWKYICAGNEISFAITDNDKLYAWGRNDFGNLGFGDTIDRYLPEQIGNLNWKMVTISNSDTVQSIIAIEKDDSLLYGWGANDTLQILDACSPSEIGKTPALMNPLSEVVPSYEWKTVSIGDGFTIAIMESGGGLYGWGKNSTMAQLGLNSTVESIYSSAQLINSDSDWIDIKCGYDHTIAIKGENELYAWGSNEFYQQGRGKSSSVSLPSIYKVPSKISNLNGWTNIAASKYMSMAAVNVPNNERSVVSSQDIYVINVSRKNYRDKISAGEWQLSLSGISIGANNTPISNKNKITTLVDETIDMIGTTGEYPTYSSTNNTEVFYAVYSGSLDDGIHQSAKTQPYGLFYPYHGIILLNGELLLSSASIQTKRTPATSSGAFYRSSNADLLFTSISGAMEAGYPFIGKNVEVMTPAYYFIRIENEEFNLTLNPSYYSNIDKLIVKDKLKTVPYPFTYITTIGLYNDEDDLLAVAKLSRPIKKTPSTEFVVKIKLDM